MKVSIYTLGCKVNTYESEYVSKLFLKEGYELVDFNCEADVCVINTCTVTNTSDGKSRKMIHQARRKNPNAVVVAMGCFTQIIDNDEDMLKYADIVIGNTNKSKIVELVKQYLKTRQKILLVDDVMKASFENMEINHFNTRTRALVKIEDGCENYCTYCIIPYVRGKVRSKRPEDVIKEVKQLVKNGYREIVLTGIHTGHYGADLENYDFSDLLFELDKIEGLERIRISSIEIVELNDKFIKVLESSKKIVDHIHIPLQAGSNHVLKLMNRRYDKEYYYERIGKIRNVRPSIAITTDVIVGFPGETNDDFNETISFVRKINFAGGHVFPYSARKNTPAAKMKGQLTKKEKHERCKALINVFNDLENDYYIRNVGKELVVIPENYKDGFLTGHTGNYLKVRFKGCKELIGTDVKVKAKSVKDGMIEASIIV